MIMADKVSEVVSSSHEDHGLQTNKEHLSFLPPPSSVPSQVSPPSDQVFLQASVVFQQLREEKSVTQQLLRYDKKTDAPLVESGERATQRQTYQLAFNTLKYQDLLENVIIDSCFHTSQHISSDLLPLAMVMLLDFQDRRFLLREHSTKEGEEPLPEVKALESSLYRCKTKLAASFARCRVKQNLQSVSCFLCDPVRTKHQRAKRLPLYAWVNTLKMSVEEVCETLRGAGLCEGKNIADLGESVFSRDPLCPDTLVFSQHLNATLQQSSLTTTHVLHIQDRSVCMAVSVLRPLLFGNTDVLVVGAFSAVTVAHIAVAATACSGRVLVCGGDHTTLHVKEIQELLTEINMKNVRVLSEAFYSLDELNLAIKHLKVILVLPQCSVSALNDPVPTIQSEHGDWDLLSELSRGSVSRKKIHTMASQQAKLLAHALTFPKVQTVVYCTRSVYPEENEQLVQRVLGRTYTHPKLLPFKVNGPIFPDDFQSGETEESKFFRLEPSHFTNGCFIARLSRQADPTKLETVHDVLARAAAKGLLGGIIHEQSKNVKKGKSRKNRVASAASKAPSPSREERQTGRELDPVAASERSETGEGDIKPSEEGEDHIKEECEKKEKNAGHKRKVKRRTKQTPTVSKSHSKSHKKNPTKKKVNQALKRGQKVKKSQPRQIPRLTLTLMSSAKQLSPITAIAHKLIDNPMIKSKESVLNSPSPARKHISPAKSTPSTPQAAKEVKRRNTQTNSKKETLADAAKAVSSFDTCEKVERPKNEVVTQKEKAAHFVLPPVPSPSPVSLHSKSGLSSISASSSSVYLPGL
ncbi:putative methyltransferase NSUN7 [Channa argus]|uniref:putative methyltransferase NSUN7 n=1 Tax=Channa argus TaxID=215402 RepID=UPI0035210AD4